jgi:hypothetical protein
MLPLSKRGGVEPSASVGSLGKHGVDDIMVFIPVFYSFQSSKTDRLVSEVLGSGWSLYWSWLGRGCDCCIGLFVLR